MDDNDCFLIFQTPSNDELRIEDPSLDSWNGNGANGALNGNGKSATYGEVSVRSNGAVENGSNGVRKEPAAAVITIERPKSSNGTSKLPPVLGIPEQITVIPNTDFSQIEGFMDPCEAGQLDTCAIERFALSNSWFLLCWVSVPIYLLSCSVVYNVCYITSIPVYY